GFHPVINRSGDCLRVQETVMIYGCSVILCAELVNLVKLPAIQRPLECIICKILFQLRFKTYQHTAALFHCFECCKPYWQRTCRNRVGYNPDIIQCEFIPASGTRDISTAPPD